MGTAAILWIWLATFLISFIMDMVNAFKVLKKAGDSGYKINLDRLRGFSDLAPDQRRINVLIWFFPGYNIYNSIRLRKYFNNDEIINQLRIIGVLEDMSLEESETYSENPNLETLIDLDKKVLERRELREYNISELKRIRKEINLLAQSDNEETKEYVEKLRSQFDFIQNGICHIDDEELLDEQDEDQDLEDGPKLNKKL